MSSWQMFDGCLLRKEFADIKEEIYEMDVYDSDVWLCTFPKSGITWAQEAAWLLGNELNYSEATRKDITVRFPHLELSMFEGHEWDSKKVHESGVGYIKGLKGRRFIKTHLPWQLLPKQIQEQTKSPKIIYMTRNTKDLVVSAHHHFLNTCEDKFAFQSFFNGFLQDMIPYCPYWDHIWNYTYNNGNKILVLKYEDLQENLKAQILRIADFLQIPYNLTEQKIYKLVDHLSFNSMSTNSMVNYSRIYEALKKANICSKKFNFMRLGKVGSYTELITPEMELRIDEWIKRNAEARGVAVEDLPVRCFVNNMKD